MYGETNSSDSWRCSKMWRCNISKDQIKWQTSLEKTLESRNHNFTFTISISLDASMPYPGLFLFLRCCSAKTIVLFHAALSLGLLLFPSLSLLVGSPLWCSSLIRLFHNTQEHLALWPWKTASDIPIEFLLDQNSTWALKVWLPLTFNTDYISNGWTTFPKQFILRADHPAKGKHWNNLILSPAHPACIPSSLKKKSSV